MAAAFFNYMCTVINFSFARMRKNYIENNDEMNSELVKKVAPYYKKTSEVIAGTQLGYIVFSGIFAWSLYRMVTAGLALPADYGFNVSEGVAHGVALIFCVIAVLLFWIFTVLLPASISLVRPLPMLSSHIWFSKILNNYFPPFIKLGDRKSVV